MAVAYFAAVPRVAPVPINAGAHLDAGLEIGDSKGRAIRKLGSG
jgi:hypothetical protein